MHIGHHSCTPMKMSTEGAGQNALGFGGSWTFNHFYLLNVVQEGRKITGEWSLNIAGMHPLKAGTIKGTIRGMEVYGEWTVIVPLELIPAEYRLKSTNGRFEVVVSQDGMSFEGRLFDKDVNDILERPLSGSRIISKP
jgi:hypothetical protein